MPALILPGFLSPLGVLFEQIKELVMGCLPPIGAHNKIFYGKLKGVDERVLIEEMNETWVSAINSNLLGDFGHTPSCLTILSAVCE